MQGPLAPMVDPQIETRTFEQLSPATAVSPNALTAVQEPGGPVVKVSIKQLLGRLVQTDTAKETRADLLADLDHDEPAVALVFADPDPAKNGWYRKTGASGAGTWTQFEKLSAFAAAEIGEFIDQASIAAEAAEQAASSAQALTNYRKLIADGVADYPVGSFFSTDELGDLRLYERTAEAPGYLELPDSTAPITRKTLGSVGPGQGAAAVAYIVGLTTEDMLNIQQVCVRRHGAVGDLNLGTGAGTDDTAAIQAAIDAVAAEGGGFVYFERGKAYKVTADIIVKENVRVDLNGATVAGYFNGGNASTFRLRSWSALFGGTVLVRSSGLPGISAPAHCPVTAGCRYGDANSVAAPNADHDPQHFEIFNLTVESDKWVDDGAGKFLGAPGIQIIGGAHYRVENIRVPASAVMYGAVHVDWGYIGTLSTADTAVAQNANKTAYNAGDAWLVPSRHGTIRNIRAGALTAPSTGTDRGSFCVRLSGVHDIIVEDCEAESVTYQAYVHEVGDLGAEFVPAAERHKLARGVRFRNCRVRSTTGQVFELKSYADNVDRAILDGYVAMADPLVECDVIFDGGGGVGPGAGATTPGVRVIQTRGGELRNVELSGFKDGILVDEKVFGTRLARCHVHGNEQDGVRVHHATFPPEDIVVEDVWAYENGQDAAYGDPAVGVHLGTSKRCKIVRGRFGKSGVANDPTQDFGWRIADGAVEATVEMPEVLSYKVGGGDAFIQRSDLILSGRKERRGPGAPFYASGVATAAVTGTTDETAFGPTITVPGGMLGKNGMIEIEVLASSTGAAGNKIVNVYLGATRMHAVVIAAGDGVARASVRIFNRNDEASQVSMLAGSGGWASNGSGVATAAIDTTADADITFKADLDVGTDSVRIEALIVRVEPRP